MDTGRPTGSHGTVAALAAAGAVMLLVFSGVAFALRRELAHFRFSNVLAHLRAIPRHGDRRRHAVHRRQLLAAGFLRRAGTALPRQAACHTRRTVFTSFIAYSFGHNFGIAAFTGGAVRYRLYSSPGLNAADVATVAGFLRRDLGHWPWRAGGRVVRVCAAPGRASHAHEPPYRAALGVVLLALIGLYALWSLLGPRKIELRGWALRAPRTLGRIAADRAGGGGPGVVGAGAVVAAAGRQRGRPAGFCRRLRDRHRRRHHQPRSRRPGRI